MVALIKNFFAKRRFLKSIGDFDKTMEILPVLTAQLKNTKKALKYAMNKAEYKSELQKLQAATRSNIDEMTNALASAKDFLATHPKAFNAKDKAMYDKKIQSFEAFKANYEHELHSIFTLTPSPVASPRMRQFTRINKSIDEVMVALPAKIAFFKKAAPQAKDEFGKTVKKIISEMRKAIVIAQNYIANNPKAFNAREKVMYEKKFADIGAMLENHESNIRRIFAATPSPGAASETVTKPKTARRVKEFCSSKNYKPCMDDERCQWVRYQGCQTRKKHI